MADGAGNVYFSTGQCVFKLDSNGTMTLVAGNSRAGYSGDGGPATGAQLYRPVGLALDAVGTLYIADSANSVVRKVSAAGEITTLAGNGSPGFSGDGAAATAAQLDGPQAVAVDSAGNVYIADTFNNLIRKVTPSGIISTVAGHGNGDFGGLLGYSGDGGPATAALLDFPWGVAVDPPGNLYIADGFTYIREVSVSGIITTIAGGGLDLSDGIAATSAYLSPLGLAVDASGNVYIVDNPEAENLASPIQRKPRIRFVSPSGIINTIAGNGATGFSGDGGPATAAELYDPDGVAVDKAGNVYIADTGNNRIREVSGGIISTAAGNGSTEYLGDGGPALDAQLPGPVVSAIDSSRNLYIIDGYRVRKISTAGIITTVAGNGSGAHSGDGGPATAAGIAPQGVAVDATGNLYITDSANNRVRKVSTDGTITTIAGTGIAGFSGDGGAAINAQLNSPGSIAVDAEGNIYFGDTRVTATSVQPGIPFVRPRPREYWPGTGGDTRVRRVSPEGTIATVAGIGVLGASGDGGAAASAEIAVSALALDAKGNLYFSDPGDELVRRVTLAGVINTVAGTGIAGFSGDGGPATNADLQTPNGVAVDSNGNLYIPDAGNQRVRMVTAGDEIFTIAGNGSWGYTGDDGPATAAELANPGGVAVDVRGNVYFGDTGNGAVRRLTPDACRPAGRVLGSSDLAGCTRRRR